MVEFERIQSRIFMCSWPKDIMELFYILGILHYGFFDIEETIQNKKVFLNFLDKLNLTHKEQFTLNEGQKFLFDMGYEKAKDALNKFT